MQSADPPLSFAPIFMQDVECAETNEKSIFQFSVHCASFIKMVAKQRGGVLHIHGWKIPEF